jgi:hypothetical protein
MLVRLRQRGGFFVTVKQLVVQHTRIYLLLSAQLMVLVMGQLHLTYLISVAVLLLVKTTWAAFPLIV